MDMFLDRECDTYLASCDVKFHYGAGFRVFAFSPQNIVL